MTSPNLCTCAGSELTLGGDGALPSQIELMPTGSFRLVDLSGAENDALVSVADTDAVISRSLANAPSGVLPIDFDHGLDGRGAKDGSAAGWITGLTVKGDRIVADVEWTKLGESALRDKTYRFVSPTFYAHPHTGEVLHISRAGLTNTPALPMLKQLAAQADPKPAAMAKDADETDDLRAALIDVLGLKKGVTAQEIVAALVRHMSATTAAATAGRGDAIPVEVVATYVAGQQDERRKEQAQRKVTAAMQAGKLPPVLEAWGQTLALENPDAFDTFVAGSLLDMLTPSGTDGTPPQIASAMAGHSPAEQIERQLGITPGTL